MKKAIFRSILENVGYPANLWFHRQQTAPIVLMPTASAMPIVWKVSEFRYKPNAVAFNRRGGSIAADLRYGKN
jgi:hypothetical protein